MFTSFPLYIDKYIYVNILYLDKWWQLMMNIFLAWQWKVSNLTWMVLRIRQTLSSPFFFFPSVTWYECFLFVGGGVQLLSSVWFFVTLWTSAHQAYLSFTISWGLLRFMSIRAVMLSNHLILCHLLLLLAWFFPNIRVFSKELALGIRSNIGALASVLSLNI